MFQRAKLIISICIFFVHISFGQDITTSRNSLTQNLEILSSAKDSIYQNILDTYDVTITEEEFPMQLELEKCDFIGNAFYEEKEDYVPNYEEYSACIEDLLRAYPDSFAVIKYAINNLYIDTLLDYCQSKLNFISEGKANFQDEDIGFLHYKIAEQYYYQAEYERTQSHALAAKKLSDSLNVSLILGQSYLALKKHDLAAQILIEGIDTSESTWNIIQRADLLVELGKDESALALYNFARKQEENWVDNKKYSQVLISQDSFQLAREVLSEECKDAYSKTNCLHNLLEYDFKYSSRDSILSSYNRLMSDGFLNDALGKYRLQLMLVAPFRSWRWLDLAKFFTVTLLLVFLIVIPYLWILPIHYIRERLNFSAVVPSLRGAKWTLRHFWLLSSVLIFLDMLTLYIFDYSQLLNLFAIDIYIGETDNHISVLNANMMLFNSIVLMLFSILMLKHYKYNIFKSGNWSILKSTGVGIFCILVLRFLYFKLAGAGALTSDEISSLSVIDHIVSINKYYGAGLGFLIIVILVPFYEEVLFRGVILSSVEGGLKFISANIIQAIIFACLHEDYSLILFYILFAMIAGILVKKSNSLIPGIVFHAVNNAIAFFTILFL